MILSVGTYPRARQRRAHNPLHRFGPVLKISCRHGTRTLMARPPPPGGPQSSQAARISMTRSMRNFASASDASRLSLSGNRGLPPHGCLCAVPATSVPGSFHQHSGKTCLEHTRPAILRPVWPSRMTVRRQPVDSSQVSSNIRTRLPSRFLCWGFVASAEAEPKRASLSLSSGAAELPPVELDNRSKGPWWLDVGPYVTFHW